MAPLGRKITKRYNKILEREREVSYLDSLFTVNRFRCYYMQAIFLVMCVYSESFFLFFIFIITRSVDDRSFLVGNLNTRTDTDRCVAGCAPGISPT